MVGFHSPMPAGPAVLATLFGDDEQKSISDGFSRKGTDPARLVWERAAAAARDA